MACGIVLALFMLGWRFATPAYAQEPPANRAALVVFHGNGIAESRCIAFAEAQLDGYQFLVRSGLALSVEQSSMGATVCSIGGVGCAFPQESCFCQCMGSPCTYWQYWRLGATGWDYSDLGASNSMISPGDTIAWVWAEGAVSSSIQPPPVASFDLICAPPTEAPTATPVATATAPAIAAPTFTPLTTPTPEPTWTAAPTWTPPPTWTPQAAEAPQATIAPTPLPTVPPTWTPTVAVVTPTITAALFVAPLVAAIAGAGEIMLPIVAVAEPPVATAAIQPAITLVPAIATIVFLAPDTPATPAQLAAAAPATIPLPSATPTPPHILAESAAAHDAQVLETRYILMLIGAATLAMLSIMAFVAGMLFVLLGLDRPG